MERNSDMIEAQINSVQSEFLKLVEQTEVVLSTWDTGALVDLQHECDERRNNPRFDYSMRVSAEVNYWAATEILEQRKKG